MIKKIKKTLMVFGFSMVVGATIAQAVPIIIETELGACYYSGQNQYDYIYTCQGGALWYVSKNQGGNGGGGGGGEDECGPNPIIAC